MREKGEGCTTLDQLNGALLLGLLCTSADDGPEGGTENEGGGGGG